MNGQNLDSNGSPEVNSMASGEAAKPKDLPEPVSKFRYVFFAIPKKMRQSNISNLQLAMLNMRDWHRLETCGHGC